MIPLKFTSKIRFTVCCLIMLFALKSGAQNKQLSLDEIWKKNTFGSKYVWGINSMNDGVHYTTLSSSGNTQYIIKYSYKTGQPVDTVFNSNLVKTNKDSFPQIGNYNFSADEKQILFSTDEERIYRHSFTAQYIVYNIVSKSWAYISSGGKQQLATFSPNGKQIAFVRNNNLYIVDWTQQTETQITFDGEKNKIINGACDWVYEEEFSFDQAFTWSPDSKKLAYYHFNESEVKEYGMPKYGTLYPEYETFKYPKAGEKNSTVDIYIYDLEQKRAVKADIGAETDQYIPRIKWTAHSDVLSCIRLNRLQNHLDLLLTDSKTGKSKIILTEKSTTYIDISDDLTFFPDNKSFLWSSELEGYNHLYQYSMEGKRLKKITDGNWDVVSFKGFDEKSQTLYFTAAYSSSINKELCKVNLNGSQFKVLSTQVGNNDANFSKSFLYYIASYSNANTPVEYTLCNNGGKTIRVLEDNNALIKKLKEYDLAKKEFSTIKTKDGWELNVWMMKPTDFDASKKYPVLFAIYGGPGHNTVSNAWEGANYMWHQLLAQNGYIVVSVDNRGTQFKGEKFKKATYGNLGMYETQDQIEAAQYFASLPFVDKSRIGMQGWSFGGYLSSLCITKGRDVFKTAIAVAPVTNWRYYDSIYTERFLGLPQDNSKGYDDNSPINFTDMLKGNYLLIHGTADDNVHFQNSVEMVSSLQKANKQFDFMMYPDKNHGIGGGNTRLNIYTLMTDFLLKKL